MNEPRTSIGIQCDLMFTSIRTSQENACYIPKIRIKRGTMDKNHIPEHFIDSMFDLVVWGHEHECRLTPEHVPIGDDKG